MSADLTPCSALTPCPGLADGTDLSDRSADVPAADHPDLGASTAEYGIVMLAAVAFAGLLAAVLGSGEVRELLMGIVTRALGSA